MPREPRDTRDKIIAAAQRLMSRRGYTAVGINEVLADAHVPKGSFYYYFTSKDTFGEAVMDTYFDRYVADMNEMFSHSEQSAAVRLMNYWQYWYDIEAGTADTPKCLAVKLGAEVADLSEPMRHSLHQGTAAIIDNIASMIREGVTDGSIDAPFAPTLTAQFLYDLWLGASVRAKIEQETAALDSALARTRELLQIADGPAVPTAAC